MVLTIDTVSVSFRLILLNDICFLDKIDGLAALLLLSSHGSQFIVVLLILYRIHRQLFGDLMDLSNQFDKTLNLCLFHHLKLCYYGLNYSQIACTMLIYSRNKI